MPDRNLREVQLGMSSRLGSIEAKQRAMTTRVWPGAMRTAAADSFSPITPTIFNSLIQLLALPGRWLVMGQFNLACAAPAGNVAFEFRLAAFDADTGVEKGSGFSGELGPLGEVDLSTYDFPSQYYEAEVSTPIRFPVTLIGDFASESDSNIAVRIQCRETNNRDWTADNIRLKLIPR